MGKKNEYDHSLKVLAHVMILTEVVVKSVVVSVVDSQFQYWQSWIFDTPM